MLVDTAGIMESKKKITVLFFFFYKKKDTKNQSSWGSGTFHITGVEIKATTASQPGHIRQFHTSSTLMTHAARSSAAAHMNTFVSCWWPQRATESLQLNLKDSACTTMLFTPAPQHTNICVQLHERNECGGSRGNRCCVVIFKQGCTSPEQNVAFYMQKYADLSVMLQCNKENRR